MPITDNQIQQFCEAGYSVMERIISDRDLEGLRAECQRNLELHIAAMDRVGAPTMGLSHRDKRYFLPSRHDESDFLQRFLFSEEMVEWVMPFIGKDAFLFLELFVVKSPGSEMPFGWHQDSGYLLGNSHRPYVTFWCALDDATEENGALHVLPYQRVGSREIVKHLRDKKTNDLIGYDGNDMGITLPVPAGSIVALSSTTFHCSGSNMSNKDRRAFLVSYSPEPITDGEGNLWNQAVPFVKDGRRLRTRSGE